MTDLEKLRFHLTNLQQQGQTEFKVNLDWLLKIIDELPESAEVEAPNIVDIDGGKF